MLNNVLSALAGKLEEFLETIFHQPEGIVKLAGFTDEDKSWILNKVVVSVVSVERETAAGIGGGNVKNGSGGFNRGYPPLKVNVNVVFAAVYDQKRYEDALSVLSAVILFLQANPVFNVSGKQKYTVELISLSAVELNNIWSNLGGHYYPSVMCKIRGVVFDAGEVRKTSGQAGKSDVQAGKKN